MIRYEQGLTEREKGREERHDEFGIRTQQRYQEDYEHRLGHEASLAERKREFDLRSVAQHDVAWQRLDLAKRQLERQITQGNQRQLLGQWRAVLDAQHKRAMEIIQSQAAGMSADERQKLLDDENKAYTDAIMQMRQSSAGGQQQGDATFDERFNAGTGAQSAQPSETKTIGSKMYVKRGDQWYEQQ